MFISRLKFFLLSAAVLYFFSVDISAQKPRPTPPEEKPEVVSTEEIKVNISAFDESGKFNSSLKKEDLVISENNILHQPSSVRHVPANVLIVMDTGSEGGQSRNINLTEKMASSLIRLLQPDDSVALIEYNDKVKVLSEWTNNKEQLQAAAQKSGLGKRSMFVDALNFATDFLEKSALDNRHLVLITNGVDNTSDQSARAAALKNVLTTNINVHVITYTELEQLNDKKKVNPISSGGRQANKELPPGAGLPVQQQQTKTYPIGPPVNLDREMIKKQKEQREALARSEKELTQLTEDTNGEIYQILERDDIESETEIKDKTSTLARNIDSQYVVTYLPKKALNESPDGEIRTIIVTSRRPDVFVQARRKLVVANNK